MIETHSFTREDTIDIPSLHESLVPVLGDHFGIHTMTGFVDIRTEWDGINLVTVQDIVTQTQSYHTAQHDREFLVDHTATLQAVIQATHELISTSPPWTLEQFQNRIRDIFDDED